MSLDVYLDVAEPVKPKQSSGIFIRENGATREISREEWDTAFPDREPVVARPSAEASTRVYRANITHNLNRMAEEAGIYKHLWRPEEIGIVKASHLIEPLKSVLVFMREDPEKFLMHSPSNGWGTYEGLISFVKQYLAACEENPDADVSVSR